MDLLRPGNAYPPIPIGGPGKVGKTSTSDFLVGYKPATNDIVKANTRYFVLGKRYKIRENGQPRPDDLREDGQPREDSIPITWPQLDEKRRKGEIFAEWTARDTYHAVDREAALKTDRHRVYNAATHYGVSEIRHRFREIGQDVITLALYSHPDVISARLRNAVMSDRQKEIRLATFLEDLTDFENNASTYDFSLFVKDPPLDPSLFPDEAAKQRHLREFEGIARKVILLIGQHNQIYKPGMTIHEMHEVYVREKLERLVTTDENTLQARIADAKTKRTKNGDGYEPVIIDLSEELKTYHGHTLPTETKGLVEKVEVLDYVKTNGRHTVLVKSPVRAGSLIHEPNPEKVLLELIAQRLGEPSQRPFVNEVQIFSQNFSNLSVYGLFLADAITRDGALYALGDPLVTNPEHAALSIVFLYPQSRKPAHIHGLTQEQTKQLSLIHHPASPHHISLDRLS